MPKEIDFASYECDCGHQFHFFANTIREAKAMSHKRTVRLGRLRTGRAHHCFRARKDG